MRTLKTLGIITLCGILGLAGFCFLIGIRYVRGDSFEAYLRSSVLNVPYRLTELPEGAQDFRYCSSRYAVGASSYAGFTLCGEDYTDFVNSFKDDSVEDMPSSVQNYTSIGSVIDDDIGNYEYIYYNRRSGSSSYFSCVLVNPETGRVVVVNAASR